MVVIKEITQNEKLQTRTCKPLFGATIICITTDKPDFGHVVGFGRLRDPYSSYSIECYPPVMVVHQSLTDDTPLKMYPPRFLFINRTSSSNGDQSRRQINRHTQLHAAARREHTRSRSQENCFPVFVSQDSSTESFDVEALKPGIDSSPPFGSKTASQSEDRDGESNNTEQRPRVLHEQCSQLINQVQEASISSEETMETFKMSSIPMHGQVNQYLDYYQSVWHEAMFNSGRLLQSQTAHPMLGCAAAMIQQCFKTDVLMYSLLANMATLMPEQEVTSSLRPNDYYCYHAIRALRHALSTSCQPTTTIIVALWHLISAEMNRGDFQAACVHLKGAISLLRHDPGIDPQYGALLRIWDCFLATDFLHREISQIPHVKASSPRFKDLDLSLAIRQAFLENKLLSPVHAKIISCRPRKAIEDLIIHIVTEFEERRPQHKKINTIISSHWLELSWRFATAKPKRNLTYIITRALAMWMYLILCELTQIKAVQPVAFSLRHSLSNLEIREWNGHEDVLMWILMVGAMVPMGQHRPEEKWYARQIIALMATRDFGFYDFTRQDDIVSFSRTFFWLDDAQMPNLEPLVVNILSLKSSNDSPTINRQIQCWRAYIGEEAGRRKWRKVRKNSEEAPTRENLALIDGA